LLFLQNDWFHKKTAAKIWAKNHVKQTEYYKNNAEQLQEKTTS
jgi:hypothetical protein